MQGSHFQFLLGFLKHRSPIQFLYSLRFVVALLVVACLANTVLGAEVKTIGAQSSATISSNRQNNEQSSQLDAEALRIAFQNVADLREENNLLKHKLNALNELQKAQSDSVSSSAVTFPIWTSILLGCVAVIVTTLGVGLAIFAYFGYREAMRRSADIAQETAANVARTEIIKKMENGEFKAVIEEAIERVALGSFGAGEDEDEDEN